MATISHDGVDVRKQGSMRRPLVLTAAVVVAAGVAFAGTVTAVSHVKLADAEEKCDTSSAKVELGDFGTTITVHSQETTEPFCVINELQPTQAVVWHLEKTRAIDGWQEDSWSGYRARWVYDPDDGISMVISTAWGL